jgi:hypothetical protein
MRYAIAVILILAASLAATALVKEEVLPSLASILVLCFTTIAAGIQLARGKPTRERLFIAVGFVPVILLGSYFAMLYFVGYFYGDSL